jgi:hypothetical protein
MILMLILEFEDSMFFSVTIPAIVTSPLILEILIIFQMVFLWKPNNEATLTSEGAEETNYNSLPNPVRECTEECAIRSVINYHEPVEWPTIGTHAINEFKTPYLATMVFPTLSSWYR